MSSTMQKTQRKRPLPKDLKAKDIYKFYKDRYKNTVDKGVFSAVWNDFAIATANRIMYEGKDFVMPHHVGPLGIRKRKIKVQLLPDGTIDKRKLVPDWKATKELWARDGEAKERKQLVFHLNKHSNGYIHKWFWDKSMCFIRNQASYSLVMTRHNKRELAKVIKDPDIDTDYAELIARYRTKNK